MKVSRSFGILFIVFQLTKTLQVPLSPESFHQPSSIPQSHSIPESNLTSRQYGVNQYQSGLSLYVPPYRDAQFDQYPYQYFPHTIPSDFYNPNVSPITEAYGGQGKVPHKIPKKFKKKTKIPEDEVEEDRMMIIYERPKFIVNPIKLKKVIKKIHKDAKKDLKRHKHQTIKMKKKIMKEVSLECKKFYKKLIG